MIASGPEAETRRPMAATRSPVVKGEMEGGRGSVVVMDRFRMMPKAASSLPNRGPFAISSLSGSEISRGPWRGNAAAFARLGGLFRDNQNTHVSDNQRLIDGWQKQDGHLGCQARSRHRRWPERPGFTAAMPVLTLEERCNLMASQL